MKTLLLEAAQLIEDKMYDAGGGPECTQFSYCTHCGRVEWREHDARCAGVAMVKKLREAAK